MLKTELRTIHRITLTKKMAEFYRDKTSWRQGGERGEGVVTDPDGVDSVEIWISRKG